MKPQTSLLVRLSPAEWSVSSILLPTEVSECLGPPNVSPHWESVHRRTLCLRASLLPPSGQSKSHSFSLILLANVQSGWVASPRKHVCTLIKHQGIFLTCDTLIWRRYTHEGAFSSMVCKWGCYLGLAHLSQLLISTLWWPPTCLLFGRVTGSVSRNSGPCAVLPSLSVVTRIQTWVPEVLCNWILGCMGWPHTYNSWKGSLILGQASQFVYRWG